MITRSSLDKKSIDKFFRYFLSFLLSLVTFAVGFFCFIAARDLLGLTLSFTPVNHWGKAAIDRFAVLIFGIVLLIFFMLGEDYYRKGVPKNKLLERFSLVTAFPLFFLGFVHLLVPLVAKPTGLDLFDFLLVGAEIGIGYLLLMLALRSRKKSLAEKN